jgi:hypothetical protein
VPSVDEFGHQILPAFKLAHVVDREDVRVIQRRRHLRFLLKVAACGGIGQFVGKKLDGDGPVQLGVVRANHHAHASLADGSLDAIRPQLESGHKRRHGGVTRICHFHQ